MSTESQTIYFDESGFTGNNLLHDSQKFFAYGSVATTDEEAHEFVSKAIKDFRVQSKELKGSALLKYNRGRKLIDSVFDHFEGRIKASVSDKRYALACKFFEYIFEPCISESNAVFYGVKFHEFIANLLYLEFKAANSNAEAVFTKFEQVMRNLDVGSVDQLFPFTPNGEQSLALNQIAEFARLNHAVITDEIDGLNGIGVGKWILDLSNTSLFTLLANWGTQFKHISAVCDESVPLADQIDTFDMMVNRPGDQVFTNAFGDPKPITFNLSEPVRFVDSKCTHGVQIADVVAAAFVYAASNAHDEFAKKWRSLMPKYAWYGSIIPDFDLVDLSDPTAARNAMLLTELCRRSREGRNLTEGIVDFLKDSTASIAFAEIAALRSGTRTPWSSFFRER